MKKFMAVLAAVFISCMIVCPCFASAAPVDNGCYTVEQWQNYFNMSENDKFIYVKVLYRMQYSDSFQGYAYASIFYKPNGSVSESNIYNFNSDNNIFTVYGNNCTSKISYGSDNPGNNVPNNSGTEWATTCRFDLANNTFSNGYNQYTINSIIDFQTNYIDVSPHVDLSFNFTPTMTGSVSRSTAVNGVMYDSQGLNINVYNNNANAQFSLFIVNHGDDISFTSQIDSNYGYTNQGFIGSPVYAFVTDEWVTVNRGFAASPIYTDSYYQPSIWHYIASHDNYYNVAPWSNMNLNRNTSYDLVAYASLNDVPNGYASLSCGDSVEEVYRSTFTILDPAIYSPADVSITGVYPWNNDSQINDIFNHSSAYQDANGNVIIRSEYGQNYLYGNGVSSVATLNTSFKDYFNFINGGLNCFPKQFLTILSAGLTGVVVVGFCKVVLH